MNVEEFLAFVKIFYNPPKNQFSLIELPRIRYLMTDGKGNPEKQDFAAIIKWFYSVVHVAKPCTKKIMGKKFGYPPTEFQFWAKNKKDFINGNKDKWSWRVMMLCPDFMPENVIEDAIVQVEKKLGLVLGSARLDYLNEGKSVQYLYVGPYGGIAKVCEKLYGEFLPENNLTAHGYYHEIYMNDPTRAMPKQRKIIIRQPVK
jgi:hypothetical protein